jgi:hypothetical protein
MTNEEMLQEMRSKRGFHAFGAAKIMRMFGIGYLPAYEWMQWLVENDYAEHIDGSPWEVRLL